MEQRIGRRPLLLASLAGFATATGFSDSAEAAPRTISSAHGRKFLINSRLDAIDKPLRYKPTRVESAWWPRIHEMETSDDRLIRETSTRGANHAVGIWVLDKAKEFEVTLRSRAGEFGLQVYTYYWNKPGRTSCPTYSALKYVSNRKTVVSSGGSGSVRVKAPEEAKFYMSVAFVSPSAYMTTSKFSLWARHTRFH